MSTVVKIIVGVIVLGGIYVWFSSYADTIADTTTVPSETLVASPVVAVPAGGFDETGTIVLDASHGLPAQPYLLYTTYSEGGSPSVRTKRLVFSWQATCVEKDLPCAVREPSVPLQADEKVHVTGTVKDDTVEVTDISRVP